MDDLLERRLTHRLADSERSQQVASRDHIAIAGPEHPAWEPISLGQGVRHRPTYPESPRRRQEIDADRQTHQFFARHPFHGHVSSTLHLSGAAPEEGADPTVTARGAAA
jgi:hypothetical protein